MDFGKACIAIGILAIFLSALLGCQQIYMFCLNDDEIIEEIIEEEIESETNPKS